MQLLQWHNTTRAVDVYDCSVHAYFLDQRYIIEIVYTEYMEHETCFRGSEKKKKLHVYYCKKNLAVYNAF